MKKSSNKESTTYVALLRGINVGGNAKVEMGKLKALFEKLGFEHVVTYINSGNVIFSDATYTREELIQRIEKGIEKAFKLKIRVLVRTAKEIEKLCKAVPAQWVNDASMKTDVLFLWDDIANPQVIGSIAANPDVDTLSYISGAVVWHIDLAHYSKSGMHKFIGTLLYKKMTARNINTVRRVYGMM